MSATTWAQCSACTQCHRCGRTYCRDDQPTPGEVDGLGPCCWNDEGDE